MAVTGLTLPALSAYDPPVAGEGSLDPMGLAAISDRLADRLAPGIRSRMQRMRFVTATAVGALACEGLADLPAADRVSTPSICFEWVVLEAFVRRLNPNEIPPGVPGSNKARNVVSRQQRLSASTYLKGPKVFGFNGVYKPFSVDAGIVGGDLEPGVRCAELVREWELENDAEGFTDDVPRSRGAALRRDIGDAVNAALRTGHVATRTGAWLFGRLAAALLPNHAHVAERRYLRMLLMSAQHENRAELARLLTGVPPGSDLGEADMLAAIRPRCSPELGRIVDAIASYEHFAALTDAVFRTLCSISYAQGAKPMTPSVAATHRDGRAGLEGAAVAVQPCGRAHGGDRRGRGGRTGSRRTRHHPPAGRVGRGGDGAPRAGTGPEAAEREATVVRTAARRLGRTSLLRHTRTSGPRRPLHPPRASCRGSSLPRGHGAVTGASPARLLVTARGRR